MWMIWVEGKSSGILGDIEAGGGGETLVQETRSSARTPTPHVKARGMKRCLGGKEEGALRDRGLGVSL